MNYRPYMWTWKEAMFKIMNNYNIVFIPGPTQIAHHMDSATPIASDS